MTTLYLAYGSNMSRRRIEARLGGCAAVGPAWIEGYALRFHKRGRDGSGKCNAQRTGRRSDRLYGVVYDLTSDQAARLDGIEGPSYRRRTLTVVHAQGGLAAYAYIARERAIDDTLLPFSWYRSHVLAGAAEFGLPVSYIRAIERIEVLPDPP